MDPFLCTEALGGNVNAMMLQMAKNAANEQNKISKNLHEHTHLLLDVQGTLKALAADTDDGYPHQRIAHDKLKIFWREKFKQHERVPWDKFFSAFPSQVPCTDPQDIKVS